MQHVESSEAHLSDRQRKVLALLRQDRALARRLLDRITPRTAPGPPPLSFAQQRLWFLDQLTPHSPFYNVAAALRIRAPIQPATLRSAFNEIVRRHEVLRTTFDDVDGTPFQLILPDVDLPLATHDLRHLPVAAREQEAVRIAQQDATTPFDLRSAPLMRIGLVCVGDEDHIFLINLHHIIADGWSIGILSEEFREIYSALAQGRPSPLPPPAIQYADYAAWQRQRIASGHFEDQLQYWVRKLEGLPLLELPTDFPHRSVQGLEGETLFVTMPLALTERVKRFSRDRSVTLFVTLHAAFSALLHRYTGQDDIVVGEPIANRNRVEIESLIGFFVNSLVLRTDVSGNPTFSELLARSRDVVLEADANQDVPFEVLVERLRPERTLGRNPLFQVSLQFFSGAQSQYAVMSDDAIHVEKGTASLDLALDLIDSDAGLVIRAEYSTELFRRETVQRMISHYQNVLDAFVADEDLRVCEVPMLSPEETRDLVEVWGSSSYAGSAATCVHERFVAQAAATPHHIALEGETRHLTYAQVYDEARRLARRLRSSGVGPERIVAVCMDPSVDLVIGMLAVWMAGGAYMPLDPAQPPGRLETVIADAQPVVVLTTTQHVALASRFGVEVVVDDGADPVDDAPDDRVSVAAPENLAYVISTSGSTGAPKGVMVEHRALAHHLQWMQDEFPLTAADRGLLKYSPTVDVSLLEVLWPLLAGGHVIVPDRACGADAGRLATIIRDRGVTVLDAVPSLLDALLERPAFATSISLRAILCGGEPMAPDLLERLPDGMDVEVWNMYGPTEATITATCWRAAPTSAERVPIGRPAGRSSAYVLDRSLNPVPPLVPGELYLGGDCLARGYLARPSLTRERFIRDPFSRDPFARLYRTGDRCRFLPDGNLDLLGRVDDQIKLRGHRIELGDVEAALGASPLVRTCAAAVRDDGMGRDQLVAYVVPATDAPELWPSVGEYFVYDELLYHAMTNDHVRTEAYRRAIEKVVRGKTVVDVGSGADLVLARMCLDAGAARVYAIEALDHAVERARRLVDELGLGDRLVVVHGDARQIELPEQVDVCVSELIGTIGSSEGAIDLLNDARRFLKPGALMIPLRCVTRIAAVSLPDDLVSAPSFGTVGSFYADRVFERLGRRFDIRVCVKNLPGRALVSTTDVFEEISFTGPVPREGSTDISLTVERAGRVDGLLLWIDLAVDADEHIDVLHAQTSWLPVFLPVFSPGVEVEVGDTITAVCSRLADPGEITPDYLIRGTINRDGRVVAELHHESRRNETAYRGDEFHRVLFERDHHDAARPPERRDRLVQEWQQLFDELYGDPPREARDPSFDIVGWHSSYTGQPLSDGEMGEQVDGTVARIRELGARRILEIGCGTGLLLLRLADGCERYVATDFSAAALAAVRQECARRELAHVELLERTADDFAGITPGSFDAVVLNSVVQYFPDLDYLARVLSGAARAVRTGGSVFVGDVRSLPLERWLAAGAELARAADDVPLDALRRRTARRVGQEEELLIEPGFFTTWAAIEPAIGDATLEVRRGWAHNELTKFRYDVVLHVGPGVRRLEEWEEWDWEELGDVTVLSAHLARHRPAAMRLRNVPNARLAAERRLLEMLDGAGSRHGAGMTAGSLRREVESTASSGVEPEALWALERDAPYTVRVGWEAAGDDGCHEVWCVARSDAAEGRWAWSVPEGAPRARQRATETRLSQRLRDHVRERLPEHMVPARVVVVDRLPVTASGKIDRTALPTPHEQRLVRADAYVAPRHGLEQQIAATWTAVLGVQQISADHRFFDLGGHSLLATQVVARLSDALQREVPLTLMFEHPTVRALAEALDRSGGPPRDGLSPSSTAGTGPTVAGDQSALRRLGTARA